MVRTFSQQTNQLGLYQRGVVNRMKPMIAQIAPSITKKLKKVSTVNTKLESFVSTTPGLSWIPTGMGYNFYFGGTSLLILVGVAMDTVAQIEAQLVMRNYEGFLGGGGRLRGRRN